MGYSSFGILGDTIGLELEVLEQERNVGLFRADILCKNTADNTFVLIENQFGDYIQIVNAPFKVPKPYASLWMGYGIGRSYTNMIVAFSQKEIMVYVQVDKQERVGWFEELKRQQDDIHAELSEEVTWDDRENLRNHRAIITRKVDMTDRENWPSSIEWMLENMQKMKDVFKPRVLALSENVDSSDEIER